MNIIKRLFEIINGTINKFALRLISEKAGTKAWIHRLIWRIGKRSEIFYQDGFIRNLDTKIFCNPDSELQDYVKELIEVPEGSVVKILDVGAGPVTMLGKKLQVRKVEITAVDPLANKYNEMLIKNNITPPVKTKEGFAERLSEQFENDYFDIAHAINSLDHCFDPVKALDEMLKVTKKGSYVVLKHSTNEAKKHNYSGLHQWNFFEEEGIFYISSSRLKVNVNKEFEEKAEVIARMIDGGNYLLVTLRKK